MNTQKLINLLGLEKHREGGYFKRTFEALHRPEIDTEVGRRLTMTSIYYLLTSDSPIGHFHKNQSDILHFFHEGDAIEYFLLKPDGQLFTVTLGSDLDAGQQLQLAVPGGWWKASRLRTDTDKITQGFGLISEAVSPGFDYKDMELGSRASMLKTFPQHQELIVELTITNVL